ncbi:uncharacterized protein EI90DRAFT_3068044 [Cantharellus anzutake]|uniref:uncharacterized protein n=1 Tax=Cantharellus anzutake TaxID=1750568 RepID=UPI001903EDA7|nr:uncharacterized protein EI90DRAFT_3068044 [Cantharellus anzutake]KAF8327142.1 hypothetical protein EI90DRAFT_3068044 [Cantharellus anzutake]
MAVMAVIVEDRVGCRFLVPIAKLHPSCRHDLLNQVCARKADTEGMQRRRTRKGRSKW